MLDPLTMTSAQWRSWDREVARLEGAALVRAEATFEPRPGAEWREFVPPAVTLEEWAGASHTGP